MDLIDQLYKEYCQCPVISTDSRKIAPGCLFFGLEGVHVDGSAFGASAIEAGASHAIVRAGACEAKPGVIFVSDPLQVLQGLAKYHRNQFNIPVIGITGSNGKTTTKELVNAVLSSGFSVHVTKGNLNNHIGVPLTLLSMKTADQIAVVEMGANHPGEIGLLCDLTRPTHGVVTNIGKAHLEGFGGIEGVKQAKAELYGSLELDHGIAFVNRDEPYLTELSARVDKRIFYGYDRTARFALNDYRFSVLPSHAGWAVVFTDAQESEWTATSSLFGRFNLANIATAIAIGLYFEIPGRNICDAIGGYIPDNNRAQRVSIGTNELIMDAYNANPTSMASAIESFATIQHPRKIMILGSMFELGEFAQSEHLKMAQLATGLHDVKTLLVGDLFKSAADRFRHPWYATVNELTQMFAQDHPEHTLFLVKGSRAMHLELLLTAFQ